ncbi:hypothetical protein FIBSPDRAFT_939587 [Athelia psychrophila]|uniref:F-box domain-containing protein n=1 Tax=Athelia psychrophila TaxID=1759441 RepID=A0A167XJH9_9AGAM|nr:hypothetical protein FIBSPDRAFT_939587 [Fibularhizoctonia sp. CBS 109695]
MFLIQNNNLELTKLSHRTEPAINPNTRWSLPSELLLMVVMESRSWLSTSDTPDFSTVRIDQRALLNFSHVCRSWYRVITNHRLFWTCLSCEVSKYAIAYLTNIVRQRAPFQPLHIQIYIPRSPGSHRIAEFARTLESHKGGCASIELVLSASTGVNNVLAFSNHNMFQGPALRSLFIKCSGKSTNSGPFHIAMSHSGLQHLGLYNIDSLAFPQVPHLTSLAIGSNIHGKRRIDLQDLVTALTNLPNLTSLTFGNKPIDFDGLGTPMIARLLPIDALPHLKTLVILGLRNKDSLGYLRKIFSILDPVKTLQAMEVEVGLELTEFLHIVRQGKSTRSESPPRVSLFPELRTISLRIANPKEDDIRGLLKHIPPVISIALTNQDSVYTLHVTAKPRPIMSKTKLDNTPQLQNLKFVFKHGSHLVRFIETAVEMKASPWKFVDIVAAPQVARDLELTNQWDFIEGGYKVAIPHAHLLVRNTGGQTRRLCMIPSISELLYP